MVDMALLQPLNKGQGRSFWYQSISHIIGLPIGCQLPRTHRLAIIPNVTDGRLTLDMKRYQQ